LARKILLADDSVTAQNMGRKILADAGYEVVTVNNGSAALKKIAELKPDLIILDVYMPGYSGLEVCQRLKDAQDTARVPVLLTVGKLEPFKPDEARRVRADGYIIKPFEASELLSALSKLEDKIVPKAEAGKPGRSGRSVAGIEDSNRTGDEPVATGSWKNRISMPGKKKAEAAEENPDGGDIYNAVNRDLKTVVAHDEPKTVTQSVAVAMESEKPAKSVQPESAQRESGQTEKLVDLGALATAGLPKDVTTEEIAALAAAAAHVQGKRAEAETVAVSAPEEVKAQEKVAAPELEVMPAPAMQESPAQESLTRESQAKESPVVQVTPAQDEVLAAIAHLEPEQERGPEQPGNLTAIDVAKSSSEVNASEVHEDVPVTMAISASRWTAVSVAVDAEEAALSLEREMQQAFREFTTAAAAEAGPATMDAAASPISAIAPEIITKPEVVTEPEVVAESAPAVDLRMEMTTEVPAAEVAAETTAHGVSEFVGAQGVAVEDDAMQPDSSARVDSSPAMQTEASAIAEGSVAETVPCEPVNMVLPEAFVTAQEETHEEQADSSVEQAVIAAANEMMAGEAILSDVPYDYAAEAAQATVEIPTSETVEVAQTDAPPAAASETAQQNESDLTATMAAAWASWRQIRDTVPAQKNPSAMSSDDTQHTEESMPSLPAAAAMAVAAGAEASPTEALASGQTATNVDSQTVANIVDSMLAELRPKILEEISRKLAAEKK
jgi:two-component system chemotaxis response regulator CheY